MPDEIPVRDEREQARQHQGRAEGVRHDREPAEAGRRDTDVLRGQRVGDADRIRSIRVRRGRKTGRRRDRSLRFHRRQYPAVGSTTLTAARRRHSAGGCRRTGRRTGRGRGSRTTPCAGQDHVRAGRTGATSAGAAPRGTCRAPRRRSGCRAAARARARSSTSSPRATLMTQAPGFIAAMRRLADEAHGVGRERRREHDEVGLGESSARRSGGSDAVEHHATRGAARRRRRPAASAPASARRRVAMTRQPNAVASAPTARPIEPSPTMPTVTSRSSRASSGCQVRSAWSSSSSGSRRRPPGS